MPTWAVLVLAMALSIAACDRPTGADEIRLAELRANHGTSFEFSISDVYLEVRAKTAASHSKEELEALYRAFWFDPGATRPRVSSAAVYMNTYDVAGSWQGQFYWDPNAEKLVFQRRQQYY